MSFEAKVEDFENDEIYILDESALYFKRVSILSNLREKLKKIKEFSRDQLLIRNKLDDKRLSEKLINSNGNLFKSKYIKSIFVFACLFY